MAKKVKKELLDVSTEEKIRAAARTIFHQKGFAATRTRDIAQEAGINLALLNYYFRSKEKLFDIIMLETMQGFMRSIGQVMNDEKTSLEKKVEQIVSAYIDLLIREPQIPMFLLSEMRTDPKGIMMKMGIREILMQSVLIKQYKEKMKVQELPLHFVQFMMNLLGLTVFPFIAAPMLMAIGDFNEKQYTAMMMERKKMIPLWVKSILKTKLSV